MELFVGVDRRSLLNKLRPWPVGTFIQEVKHGDLRS